MQTEPRRGTRSDGNRVGKKESSNRMAKRVRKKTKKNVWDKTIKQQ